MTAVALSEVATFLSGGTPSKANASYWSGEIPWVSPKDMRGPRITDAEDHISHDAVAGSATKLVQPGTLLVVARSGILARRMPVAVTDAAVAFNQDIKAMVVDSARALPEFVFWFLRASEPDILRRGVKLGATVHSLASGFLEGLQMPLYPLDEQRRIVDLLSRAESLKRLAEEAQAKARELIPALFVDMFGDPASNPKGWPVISLGDTLDSADYGTSVKANDATGVPVLRMGNVSYEGDLSLRDLKYVELPDDQLEKQRLRKGDILFNRTNSKELVGKTALWSGEIEAVAASYFIRVRTNAEVACPTFIWAFMNSAHMKSRLFETARGAIGQANINGKELRALQLPIPPLELQRQYAERIAEILSIRELVHKGSAIAERAAVSLMARLFAS